jgi:hypothetical protein
LLRADGQVVATLNHAELEAAACFTRKAHSNQALDALALSGVRSTFIVRISSYAMPETLLARAKA